MWPLWVSPALGLAMVVAILGLANFARGELIAVIFIGIGSLSGAFAGGLILGFIEVSLRTYLPESGLPFRDAIGYFIVTLVLLRWPDGLISIRRRE